MESRPVHVFVAAISVFPGSWSKKNCNPIPLRKTHYVYGDDADGLIEPFYCEGYYQMEPVPQFITGVLKEKITHVIMLATNDAKNNVQKICFDKESPDGEDFTAVSYFERFLHTKIDSDIKTIVVDVDERRPETALEDTMKKIRELYSLVKNPDDWRLWMDTHGSFRDLSTVLVSAARFFATDQKEPIRTDRIFSVYHSQDPEVKDRIADQTAFYFSHSAEALKEFMYYGQYLTVDLQKCDGSKPYAFVSYRHDNKFYVSIRNFFMKLKEQGILFWFDDGIGYGENWRKTIELRNRDSSAFILLVSNSYFESPECWRELLHAIHQKEERQQKIHVILLEEHVQFPSAVPAGMEDIIRLQKELDVSDDQILHCFQTEDNTNWLKWFKYMDKENSIQQRSFDENDLMNGLKVISESM